MFLESRFEQLIDRICRNAAIPLRVELWNGRRFDLAPNPTVRIAIPNRSALRYFVPPNLCKLGEAFVEGHIRVQGPIHEVFRVAEKLACSVAATTRAGFHRFARHSRDRDLKAIQYHYDVSNEFYSLFLDSDLVYSCAYYRRADDSLETAQSQKLDHILNKLALKPGERFLDIGCGWGALAVRAAKQYGAIATGITLSENQLMHARERIRVEGLQDRCTVELCDYRDVPGAGRFDKIASVGMFEHVGLKNLPLYFGKIRSLLTDDGLVLNHGITTSDPDNRWMRLGAGEFIDRYVFPDGELPHLSLVLKEMAVAGLEAADVESLRRHYARTCHEWADRLEANRERAVGLAGEKRVRIWEVYLAGCAYGFARGWMNVYQVLGCQVGRPEADALPLTREYVYCGNG
ncbi:MAG: class I SAM-dependent methyltransferase [Betaproteobacteria bacterium]|nr:class I SAM-dependent methyltransferase [Betaproteobacteria bacterium]